MQIVVMSDTHGEWNRAKQVFDACPNADVFIHCGDIGYEPKNLPLCCYVKGNHDACQSFPLQRVLHEAGYTIFVTHGQRYEQEAMDKVVMRAGMHYEDLLRELVLKLEDCLYQEAKKHGCQIVLYGHTHVSSISQRAGVWLINPGSLAYGESGCTYAVIELGEDVKAEIRKIKGE